MLEKMIVSITHELDLDGLGSQAIIKRCFTHSNKEKAQEMKLYYAHYTNFITIVKQIINNVPLQQGQFIISDIGFNDDFRELFSLFSKAEDNYCEILWFDHHIIDKNNEEELQKLIKLYLNDPKRCTAEIIKDHYLPDDFVANKIAKFSRDIDFQTKKYEVASNLQSIIAYNRGYELDDVKKKIVDLMSVGKFEDPWFDEELVKVKQWENKQTEFALNHVKIIEIKDFGKILISFATLGGGKIVSVLKDHFTEIKCYIGIDFRYNEIIIHSDYVNCRELARTYKGGGHKNRAGFKFDKIFTKGHEISREFVQNMEIAIYKFKLNGI